MARAGRHDGTGNRTTQVIAAGAMLLVLALVTTWFVTVRWRAAHDTPDPSPTPRPALTENGEHAGEAPREGSHDAGLQRNADDAPIDDADASPSVPVLVLDESGAPLPGATVRVDPEALARDQYRNYDGEAAVADRPAQVSDADGLVQLPVNAAAAMVVARAGELYAQSWIQFARPLTDPIELRLGRDHTVRVRVTTTAGEPAAGVEIQNGYSRDDDADEHHHEWRPVEFTDERGELRVPHAQRLFADWPPRPELLLRAALVGENGPSQLVRVESATAEITLTCAAFGTVRGVAYGWDQRPMPEVPNVQLQRLEANGSYESVRRRIAPTSTEGGFELPAVPLGRRWRIGSNLHEFVDVVGPTQAGEVVEVELRRLQTEGLLRFQVFGPDGTTLTAARVEVSSPSRSSVGATTDHNGTATIHRGRSEELLRVVSPSLHAAGELPVPKLERVAEPTLDAGVVHLAPMQLLAQGRVIDGYSGLPATAFVSAVARAGDRDVLAEQRCDERGEFELWAMQGEAFELRVRAAGYDELTVPVRPGTRDVVVQLAPERRLFVRLLLDEGIDDDEVTLAIEPGRSQWATWRTVDGVRQHVMALPDGDDLTLLVSPADDAEPVLRVPRAAWRTGRLGMHTTVDLRGRLVMSKLRVQRAGQPLEVRFYLPGRGDEPAQVGTEHEVVMPITTDREWPIIVLADTAAPQRVLLRPGEQLVELSDPTRLKCTIVGAPPAVPPDAITVVLCRLRRREPLLDELCAQGLAWLEATPKSWPCSLEELEGSDDGESAAANVDEELPEGEFVIARRGTYVVVPLLRRNRGRRLLADAARVFDLDTLGGELVVPLELETAAVQAAWEQMGSSAGDGR